MKKSENPLEFSQKLEAFQTARKAKEVNEIYKFDSMKESLKQRHLTLGRRMDMLHRKSLRKSIEEPEIPEEHILQEKAQALRDVAEFERQAYDAQVDAPDNEFDTIAAIQGFRYESCVSQENLQRLPEAHSDAFAHELTALTERELHKELEQNEKALQDSLKSPDRLDVSPELRHKEPEVHTMPANHDEPEKPEQKNAPEPENDSQETTESEISPQKNTSESSLIYFRSSSPPSEE